jgi:site-specific recombinase XerC
MPPEAPETVRLYQADWGTFATWCAGVGLAALPATPSTVAAFLAVRGEALGAGALGRRAAAIAARHRQQGFASPAADPAVRAILREARRTATPRRKPPPRPAQLRRMAAACPGDLAGLRDRALLVLASVGLGRAALVGLDVEHLRFTATSVELALRQRGPEGDSERRLVVACAAALRTCPVQALRDWLRSSDTRFGPLFRKVDRWGNIEHRRLGTDAVRRILTRRVRRTPKPAA